MTGCWRKHLGVEGFKLRGVPLLSMVLAVLKRVSETTHNPQHHQLQAKREKAIHYRIDSATLRK